MKLKLGALTAGLTPRAQYILQIMEEVYAEFGLELVVTGGTELFALKDGKLVFAHMKNSQHFYGEAIDGRIAKVFYGLDIDKQQEIADRLRVRLEEEFTNDSKAVYPGVTYVKFHPDHHIHAQVKG